MAKKSLTESLIKGMLTGNTLGSLRKALDDVQDEINQLINKYDPVDVPFLAAAMFIAANSMKSVMGKEGRDLYDFLTKNIGGAAAAIDLSELIKQAGGNGGS